MNFWRRAGEALQGVVIAALLAAFTVLIFAALLLRQMRPGG